MMSNNSQRLAQETNVLATSSQKLIHQSQNAMRIMNEQNSFLLFLSDEVQFLRRQNSDLRDAKEDLQGRVADLGSKNTNLEKKKKKTKPKECNNYKNITVREITSKNSKIRNIEITHHITNAFSDEDNEEEEKICLAKVKNMTIMSDSKKNE